MMAFKDDAVRFTKKNFIKEIYKIGKEEGIPETWLSICISSGGLSYAVEHVASHIFLNNRTIKKRTRNKVIVLHEVAKAHLDWTNDKIKEEKSSWAKRSLLVELEGKKKELFTALSRRGL